MSSESTSSTGAEREIPPQASDADLAAFLRHIEALRGPDHIGAIVDWVPGLASRLAEVDPLDGLRAVGGLLTVPALHGYSLRLEALGNVLAARARGRRRADRRRLTALLNQAGVGRWAAMREDPIEDVFVGNVVTPGGNRRVLLGAWKAGDLWLQWLLDSVGRFADSERWARSAIANAQALLDLSDLVAERAGLVRYTKGADKPDDRMAVPDDGELRRVARRVVFSGGDLSAAALARDRLAPFMFDLADRPALAAGLMEGSALERRPLILAEGEIIFALPSSITATLLRYLIELADAAERVDALGDALAQVQADAMLRFGLRPAHVRPAPPVRIPRPAANCGLVEAHGAFDVNRPLHAVLLTDHLRGIAEAGLEAGLAVTEAQARGFTDYLEATAAALASRSSQPAGMTLVTFGGVGRPVALPTRFPQPPWRTAYMSLPELLLLTEDEGFSLLRLWKLCGQRDALEAAGTGFVHMGGDANLYGYWRANGFALLPRAADSRERIDMLNIGHGYLERLLSDARQRRDDHAVWHPGLRRWTRVCRVYTRDYFAQEQRRSSYGSLDELEEGRLLGVVEAPARNWFVTAGCAGGTDKARDLQFRFWVAVLSWLPRLASVLEESFALPSGAHPTLHVSLTVSDADLASAGPRLGAGRMPPARVDPRATTVTVEVDLAALALFNRATNDGERALLASFVQGLATLAGCVCDVAEADALAVRVTGGPDARHIHLFASGDRRDYFLHLAKGGPCLVPPEDIAASRRDVVWAIARPPSGPDVIAGPEPVKAFMTDVTQRLWERLRDRLRALDRRDLVRRCLQNLNAIEADRAQWRRTVRAVMALHGDTPDVRRAVDQREAERSRASTASRVLVEMAVCESPTSGAPLTTDADLDVLLAEAALLAEVGMDQDAVHYGWAKAEVTVHPDGSFDLDDQFKRDVAFIYAREAARRAVDNAAASYADLYRPREATTPTSTERHRPPPEFVHAWKAEVGAPLEALFGLVHWLFDEALRDGREVFELTAGDLVAVLGRKGVPEGAARAAVAYFTLPPRARWDRAPSGYEARDWYPWRYGRRLSLLARPLVAVSGEELLVSPALFDLSLRYLVASVLDATLPPEFFRSPEMRSFVGQRGEAAGRTFEAEVADCMRACGLEVRTSVRMSELGVPKAARPLRQSDVDVLAWHRPSGRVFVVECKRVRPARTVGEIAAQLSEYRGVASDDAGRDKLCRHMERYEWLRDNPTTLAHVIGMDASGINLVPLLVTSAVVPMQFVATLPYPTDMVVPLDDLEQRLPALLS